MKNKIALTALAVAVFAGSLASAPAPANAGGKDAAAFLGGLFVGGAVASAARPTYSYDYGYPVVQQQPVYVQPQPVYVQPVCRWQKVQIWDPYVGHYVWRKQQVCG
jgi:hypothetical protein